LLPVFGKAFYIFFVAAFLLAAGWNFLADDGLKAILMRLFVISLGLSMFCLAQEGIVQNGIRLGSRRTLVRRDRNPLGFWGIIVFTYALAFLLLGVGMFVPV
jgi:hypothetical protein